MFSYGFVPVSSSIMLSGDGWLQIGARSSVSTMLIRLWLTIRLWILPYMNYVMQKKVLYKMSGRGQEVDDPLIYLSLWPSDAIWWHRSGSTLAQIRASCIDSTKPLPESYQSSPVVFTWGQFHWKCLRYQSSKYVAKLPIKNDCHISRVWQPIFFYH